MRSRVFDGSAVAPCSKHEGQIRTSHDAIPIKVEWSAHVSPTTKQHRKIGTAYNAIAIDIAHAAGNRVQLALANIGNAVPAVIRKLSGGDIATIEDAVAIAIRTGGCEVTLVGDVIAITVLRRAIQDVLEIGYAVAVAVTGALAGDLERARAHIRSYSHRHE